LRFKMKMKHTFLHNKILSKDLLKAHEYSEFRIRKTLFIISKLRFQLLHLPHI